MNSHERMHRRMAGEAVDRIPNFDIMMTFAAHFIGAPLSRYYLDYHTLCEANVAVIDAFELDIAQAISDPYREAADFGAEITFPEDGLPIAVTPLLQDPTDLLTLPTPDPATGRRMSDRLAAVRHLRERVGDDVPVMGWVEGALAEAADLRGVSYLLMDLYDRPDFLHDLLAHVVQVEIAFAQAQIEAGAHIIGLGDAVASQISPPMYRRWALPYEQQIFEAVHAMGALARMHICGDTSRILSDMAQSGADIIDIDWMMDMTAASETFGPTVSVCGNFDPVSVMFQGTPGQVYAATQACMRQGGPRALSAAGCEIPDGTPHANLKAQTRALRE